MYLNAACTESQQHGSRIYICTFFALGLSFFKLELTWKGPAVGVEVEKWRKRVSAFPRWEYITLFSVIFKRKLRTLDDFLTVINCIRNILCFVYSVDRHLTYTFINIFTMLSYPKFSQVRIFPSAWCNALVSVMSKKEPDPSTCDVVQTP